MSKFPNVGPHSEWQNIDLEGLFVLSLQDVFSGFFKLKMKAFGSTFQ